MPRSADKDEGPRKGLRPDIRPGDGAPIRDGPRVRRIRLLGRVSRRLRSRPAAGPRPRDLEFAKGDARDHRIERSSADGVG